jgi:two-component system response regulator QseB
MRILLVEDDELLGAGVSQALARTHYAHEWVRDGKSALEAAGSSRFDLVVLDLGLPQLEGMEVLRRMRGRGNGTAVLILSARDTARDRVLGLNAGADDYLVKPFDLDELLARIHALERRMSGGATNQLQHGRIVLDLDAMSVACDGAPVELKRREFMLLRKLIENPTQVFSRGQLEESVYGWHGDVESNAIDVHVHRLRRKLYPEVIRTVRGIGYRIDPLQAS